MNFNLFLDSENNIISVIGLGLNELIPQEEEEIEKSEPLAEELIEQTEANIEETPIEAKIQSTVSDDTLPQMTIGQERKKILVNCPNSLTGSTYEWETLNTYEYQEYMNSIPDESFALRSSIINKRYEKMLEDEEPNIIYIDSDITTNEIWTANNIYYVTQFMGTSALLVIEPGTVVMFAYGASMDVFDGGTLIACGTPDKPIIFTTDYWPGYAYPGYYFCAIYVEPSASPSTRIEYVYVENAQVGIVTDNIRLDNPIENNYLFYNAYGIGEGGPKNMDIINNLCFNQYWTGIDVYLRTREGQGDANSHILIENNTSDSAYLEDGICIHGVDNPDDAGWAVLANNIVSNSYRYGISLQDVYMYLSIINTGYYNNWLDRYGYEESDENNPIYESEDPYDDPGLRQDCAFVNASDEYIEQTQLIGKTTDINDFPDSNLADLGFHYPNWNFSNAGDAIMLSMDLNQDLIVNFKDFAWLATGWQIAYDIYDLNTMADEWLNIANAHPPIAVNILGDPNNLTEKVDVGIGGRSYNTTEGFIYLDGELKGYIDYTEDPETTYELASIDTQTLGNGQHDIKAVVIDTNGLITVSPTISVDTNNDLYYITKAYDFNEGEDYHLYAMSNSTNELRVKLVGWDGNNVWTSSPSTGGLNVIIPSSILSGAIYDLFIEKAGIPPGWELIWSSAISKKYKINDYYKVAIFLPNGTFETTGEPTADCRKEAVAELVRWCTLRNMKFIVLYKGQCTWQNFATVLSHSSTNYVYMVAHGHNLISRDPNDPNPIHRLSFWVSGRRNANINDIERVVSRRGGLPGGMDTNPLVHSMEDLGLYQWIYIRLVYMTICYQGESEEMALKWLNKEFEVYIDQLLCGWVACASGSDPDWKQWDFDFWCQLGNGQKTVQEVIPIIRGMNPRGGYIFGQFRPIGDQQVKFEH